MVLRLLCFWSHRWGRCLARCLPSGPYQRVNHQGKEISVGSKETARHVPSSLKYPSSRDVSMNCRMRGPQGVVRVRGALKEVHVDGTSCPFVCDSHRFLVTIPQDVGA